MLTLIENLVEVKISIEYLDQQYQYDKDYAMIEIENFHLLFEFLMQSIRPFFVNYSMVQEYHHHLKQLFHHHYHQLLDYHHHLFVVEMMILQLKSIEAKDYIEFIILYDVIGCILSRGLTRIRGLLSSKICCSSDVYVGERRNASRISSFRFSSSPFN